MVAGPAAQGRARARVDAAPVEAVLVSIQTRYADQVFDGTKRYEFRKDAATELRTGRPVRLVIYSSGTAKAVVGEATVRRVLAGTLDDIWRQTSSHAGSDSYADLKEYYGPGRTEVYALELDAPRRYAEPLALSDIWRALPGYLPPQRYVYLRRGDVLLDLINARARRSR